MKKEELRKDFENLVKDSLPNENIHFGDVDFAFDWFYSKLEEKDKEIQKRNAFIDKCSNEMTAEERIKQLEAKLKAADDVIKTLSEYVNSISGRDINADWSLHRTYIKAIEHYKSLK